MSPLNHNFKALIQRFLNAKLFAMPVFKRMLRQKLFFLFNSPVKRLQNADEEKKKVAAELIIYSWGKKQGVIYKAPLRLPPINEN